VTYLPPSRGARNRLRYGSQDGGADVMESERDRMGPSI